VSSATVYAFAAAALGGMDSAIVGGWVIGVSESLASSNLSFHWRGPQVARPAGHHLRRAARAAGRARRLPGGGTRMSSQHGRLRVALGVVATAVVIVA
jgi:hypothetical protein